MTLAARGITIGSLVAVALIGARVSPAQAAIPAPAWTVTSVASDLVPGDSSGGNGYFITATNTGAAATDGSNVTITDTLPSGLSLDPVGPTGGDEFLGTELACSPGPPITCTDPTAVPSGGTVFMFVPVDVAATPPSIVTNTVTISGGGAPTVSNSSQRPTSASPGGFAVQNLDGSITNADGSPDTQAGSHPYQASVSFGLNMHYDANVGAQVPNGDVRDLTFNLPVGVVVNPNATLKCTESQFESNACPDSSAVGTIVLNLGGIFRGVPGAPTAQMSPIYNLVAPAGAPANLGFNALGINIFEHLLGHVRTGSDYGLSASASDILQKGVIVGGSASLWGNPSDPSHDPLRGSCALSRRGQLCPVPAASTAFLTLPSACSGPLTTTASADSWQNPGTFVSDSFQSHDSDGNLVGVTGCSRLDWSPGLTVKPDTAVADSPSGLSVDLKIPQNESINGLAEANLKQAIVTLPPDTSINPAAADGLAACSSAQIDIHSPSSATCPDASKIGSVEISTPLLDHPLDGGIFLAQPADNPFDSLLAIYIAIDDPQTGIVIKLAGHVVADPATGQITTTFDNNPQLPFSDLKLSFFGGPRAALVTPSACAKYETEGFLTPWSATAAAAVSDPFSITSGCRGGFAPSFSAGTLNNQAGGFSPFSVTLSRRDGEQRLGALQLQLPEGLLGLLKNITQCSEPQASQGACDPESLIGHTTVGAGPGSDPFYIGGNVFLTGPYKGAPFGLSVVVHALAGPFDLGNVTVRAAINVDPHTGQITVTSDPLPTILQGIPLDLQTVNVSVDRPGFMFNPTNCAPLSVTGTIASTNGASAEVSDQFEAANCANLPFKPAFSASTQGKTSKANGASLVVNITQKPGEANIHKVELTLPLALPARLTTLQKACTEVQFNINPARCPEGSFIGTAKAITPVLNAPLVGPAILVSHGSAAFPDVEFLLQGEGAEIVLDGKTDIKKGITYSRFETVPDAPISSFETVLPEGPHSALAAYGNLCAQRLVMPTTIVGQSGAQIKQRTNVAVTGCRPVTISKRKLSGRSVILAFNLTAKGTVTVTGRGLKRYHRTLGAGFHQIRVALSRVGLAARRHHRKVRIKVALRSGSRTSSATTTLKL